MEDDAIRVAALNVLQSTGYAALRPLRCEEKETIVIVTSEVPLYYLKQMSQVILQRLECIQSVTSLVEVRETDLVRLVDDEGATFSTDAPLFSF